MVIGKLMKTDKEDSNQPFVVGNNEHRAAHVEVREEKDRLTPGEMRDAADVLEEWSGFMDYMNPSSVEWSADELRREAEMLELEL